MTERWRLLHDWDGEGGFQMAVDEALLLEQVEQPTLRFYTWEPDALSLGYFQRLSEVPRRERASLTVRRLTGGGAIHHRNELTFSIAAPAAHALYRGPVAESYARIHALLAGALADFGVDASLRGESSPNSDRTGTGMCFHQSTPLDLVWDRAKGVGSAQRRTAGRVLHHGSIKLGPTELDSGVAQVGSDTSRPAPQDLAEAIRIQFEDLLGVQFASSQLDLRERRRAEDRGPHFYSVAFLNRRP